MNYRIVEGRDNIPLDDVVRLLKTTYWAKDRTVEQIDRAMCHSACYGILLEGETRLAGFARVITDETTAYYLCDVVVDEAFRGMGLGTALVAHIANSPEYAGLRAILITRDAHALYRKFGFEVLNDRVMVKNPSSK